MAEKQIVKVAAVQIAPDLDTPTGTLDRVLAAIAEAAGKGARLAVFPETFVPWYPYFSFIRPPMSSGADHIHLYDNAVVVPGPVTEAVAAAARKHNIVVVLGVNERDHGTLYNAQLIFNTNGALVLKRRKITPTFHERMIWGQGDGSGLKVVDTAIGRIGALACWEHYNPLARYALMAQHEEIHVAQFPGSLVGPIFGEQIEVKMALSEDLRITRADPAQIEQVLMNLFFNARDAMPAGGQLLIETRNLDLDEKYCSRHADARPGR